MEAGESINGVTREWASDGGLSGQAITATPTPAVHPVSTTDVLRREVSRLYQEREALEEVVGRSEMQDIIALFRHLTAPANATMPSAIVSTTDTQDAAQSNEEREAQHESLKQATEALSRYQAALGASDPEEIEERLRALTDQVQRLSEERERLNQERERLLSDQQENARILTVVDNTRAACPAATRGCNIRADLRLNQPRSLVPILSFLLLVSIGVAVLALRGNNVPPGPASLPRRQRTGQPTRAPIPRPGPQSLRRCPTQTGNRRGAFWNPTLPRKTGKYCLLQEKR